MATRARHRIFGLKPDVDYELQMSAVIRGIEGPKSARFKFRTAVDEMPPGPVTNLTLDYVDGILILSWEAPTVNEDGSELTDLLGYLIEVTDNSTGTVSSFDTEDTRVEFSLQFLRWLFDGTLSGDYSFNVLASDKAGNLSQPVEVSFAATPPAPFNMISWAGGNQSITIYWEESVDIDLTHYEVYRNGVLVGRTIGTETEFTDGNPGSGEHEYYAIAYDAFGLFTQSTNTLTGAKSFGYWQGDASVPRPPSAINILSEVSSSDGALADVTIQFAAPIANQDNSDYEDHNEFIIEWSKSVTGPWQTLRISDDRTAGTSNQNFEVRLNDLTSSTVYHFRLAAVDRYSNKSAWANESHTTAQDEDAPSQPSAPIAAGGLLRIQVTHNMTKQNGGLLEEDVRELKVYIDTTSSFTPSTANYAGSISTLKASSGFRPNGSFPVEDPSRRYVKVVAVDSAGNESLPSPFADSTDIELIKDQYVENASITNASIANLSAAKLIAGTAFVNDLGIESLLTVQSGGIVQSSNYVPNLSGWRLSDGGLELNNGTVAASALTINNSPNLLPWAYASFEQDSIWFFGGTDAAGNTVQPSMVANSRASTSSLVVNGWEGESSLRFRSAVDTSLSLPAEILFTPSTATYDITVEAGERYIYAFYAKSAASYSVRMVARWQGSVTTESVEEVVIPNTGGNWRRFSAVFTAPSGATGLYVGLRTLSPNVDVYVDAQQVELVTSAAASSLLVPSAWKAPTMTSIDGGMIRTGEIKSTNFAQTGGVPTAGWRVGLEGNASFRNIFARGTIQADAGYLQNMSVYSTLTVGNAANDTTSRIQSFNGNWYIRGDGYLYAANANIAGTITAYGGSFSNVSAFSMFVGSGTTGAGYIQSSNYNGSADGSSPGSTGWLIRNGSGRTAVFNNVFVRGDVQADNLTGTYTVNGSKINGGTIEGVVIRTATNISGEYIQLGNYSGGGGVYWYNSSGGSDYMWGVYDNRLGWGGWRSGVRVTNLNVDRLHITTQFYMDGNASIGGTLFASGLSASTITLSSTATFNGSANFNNGLTVNSGLAYLSQGLATNGNTTSAISGIDFSSASLTMNGKDIRDVDDIFTSSSTAYLGSSTNPFERVYTSSIYRTNEYALSSLEYKNVKEFEPNVLDEISELDIILFSYKHDKTNSLRYGVSYESASKYIRQYNEAFEKKGIHSPEFKGVEVTSMVGLALGGIKQLLKRVEALEEKVKTK